MKWIYVRSYDVFTDSTADEQLVTDQHTPEDSEPTVDQTPVSAEREAQEHDEREQEALTQAQNAAISEEMG